MWMCWISVFYIYWKKCSAIQHISLCRFHLSSRHNSPILTFQRQCIRISIHSLYVLHTLRAEYYVCVRSCVVCVFVPERDRMQTSYSLYGMYGYLCWSRCAYSGVVAHVCVCIGIDDENGRIFMETFTNITGNIFRRTHTCTAHDGKCVFRKRKFSLFFYYFYYCQAFEFVERYSHSCSSFSNYVFIIIWHFKTNDKTMGEHSLLYILFCLFRAILTLNEIEHQHKRISFQNRKNIKKKYVKPILIRIRK